MKNDDLLNKDRRQDIGTYLWSILKANWGTMIDTIKDSDEWTKALELAENSEDYKEFVTKYNSKLDATNKLNELIPQLKEWLDFLSIGNPDADIDIRRNYSYFKGDEWDQAKVDKTLKGKAKIIAKALLGIDDEDTRLSLMKEELNARLALVKIGTFDDIVDNLLEEIDVEDYRF